MTATRVNNRCLILIILASFSSVDYFFDAFFVPLPSLPTDVPHLMIFCLAVYAIDLQFLHRVSKPVFYPSFFYIGFILAVWVTVQMLHGFISGELGRVILTNFFWFALIHQMIRTHLRVSLHLHMDQTEFLKRATLYIILAFAIIHLLLTQLSGSEFLGDFISKEQLYGRNGFSFLCLLGIYLLLFYKEMFVKKIFYGIAFGILGAIPFVNATRGAIIVLFVLILIKCSSLIWKYNKRVFAGVAIAATIAVSVLFPYIIKEKIEELTFGLNPKLNLSYEQIMTLPDPEPSTYIRNMTALMAFRAFIANPVIGVGFAKVKKELKIASYWCHTFYLLPLAAYGLIGFLPFFFFLMFEILQNWKISSWTTVAFCVFILGTLTFTNDLFYWFAIPLNIFWSDAAFRQPEIPEIVLPKWT